MYIHYFKIIDSKKKRLWLNVAHLKMNKWDTWAEPLVTPQLISVQDFAFRRRLLLALQSTARRIWTGETYVHFNKKNEPL